MSNSELIAICAYAYTALALLGFLYYKDIQRQNRLRERKHPSFAKQLELAKVILPEALAKRDLLDPVKMLEFVLEHREDLRRRRGDITRRWTDFFEKELGDRGAHERLATFAKRHVDLMPGAVQKHFNPNHPIAHDKGAKYLADVSFRWADYEYQLLQIADRLEAELPNWLDAAVKRERRAELIKEHGQRLAEHQLTLEYQRELDELDHVFRKEKVQAEAFRRLELEKQKHRAIEAAPPELSEVIEDTYHEILDGEAA